MAPKPQTSPCFQEDHAALSKRDAHLHSFFPHSLPSVFPVILPSLCFSTACTFPALLPAAPSLVVAPAAGGRDTAQVSSLLTQLRL